VIPVQNHIIPAPEAFSCNLLTRSAAATADLGRRAAGLLTGGEILLLNGPLGAGKTCFIQGLCAELAVTEEVVSPTFTLVNTYTGGRLKVHHLDFYRVEAGDDLNDIGVPDILDEVWDGQAVLLVEWPEPLRGELTADQPYLELLVVPGDQPDSRRWHLRAKPEVPDPWRRLFDAGAEDASC
jgi:tRNA threonylcarbamoyladenosine biosynthesis protein TsaE